MKEEYSKLFQEKSKLSRANKQLYDENRFLATVNEAFANENDELHDKIERYARYRLPKSIERQETEERPTKRRKEGKKVVHVSDELEDESNNSPSSEDKEQDEKNEIGARVGLILFYEFSNFKITEFFSWYVYLDRHEINYEDHG